MSTLIIAVETVGQDWDVLPITTQLNLTKWIERNNESPQVKEKQLQEVREKLSLSPFTSQIVSLAMYDLERNIGAVYFVSEEASSSFKTESFSFKSRTEKEILEDFWEGARGYDNFVTFNGRTFCVPFLYHRSAMNRIRPTVDIAKERYLIKQPYPHHVDLLDEFTFYGAVPRRPSLQLLADAYGVKLDSEVKGEDVAELFQQKKFRDIARRSASAVLATKALFEIWRDYLAPQSFVNTQEM